MNAEPRSGAWRTAVFATVLAATILAVHAPWPGANLTAHHDNLDGAAPLRVEAARQWLDGHAPLWNPYKRAGMPLLADTTAGAIYPGNLPFLFAAGEPSAPAAESPVFHAMDRVAALHAVLAGLLMFAFLRSAGLARGAATFGGLVYGACGTMGWFAAWYIQLQNSAAWLPLVLLAVHRAADDRTRPLRWITVGGLAVALQFFAGYPETSFYTGLLAIGYAASRSRREAPLRPFVAVAAVYAAGLLLAAVQLLPAVELQLQSRRPAVLDLATFQSLPATLAMVKSWVLPGGGGGFEFPPAAATHFGFAVVLAAALGLFTRSRLAAYFAAVFATGFLLAVGPATPVSAWAWHLPGLSAFRHPFKHLFEVSFAMAGLAALGAARLTSLEPRPRWVTPLLASALAFTAVAMRANQASLVFGNPASVDTSGRPPEIVSKLEPGWRAMTLRQVFQKREPGFLLGDYATQFRVPAVHGAGPYLWTPLAEATGLIEEETTFRRGLFAASDRTLALLSCRYALQTRAGGGYAPAMDLSGWRLLEQSADSRWMQRSDALPRLRFVSSVRCATPAEIDASLQAGTPEPRDVALVDCAAGEAMPAVQDAAPLRAEVIEERAGFLALATTVPAGAEAFLVVSQADFPGWKASADGAPVAIRRVHGLVQGLAIPGGTSRVELSYEPGALNAGAAASAATLLLLLAGCVMQRQRDDGA